MTIRGIIASASYEARKRTHKLVSAVASKLPKSAAFEEVSPGGEAAFLHPLANKGLPGISPKTSLRLNAAGLTNFRHIAATRILSP